MDQAPAPPTEHSTSPLSPSERLARTERAQRMMLLAVRLIYMVILMTVTLLPFVGTLTSNEDFGFAEYGGAFVAMFLFGVLIIVTDAFTPNKKLASVFGIYLGIVAGLVSALAIGALLDLIAQSWDLRTEKWAAYLGLVKLGIGITLCYLAVSIVLTTKDDFRLVIPYVEFARQVRGIRPLLLDTSVLIDGRIVGFAETGFLDAPLVVPRFVLHELQALADSSDKLKRARGRRGLDVVRELQACAGADVIIDPVEVEAHSVDHMLLRVAAEQQLRVLTTDYNLNKVAQIHGVTVLNLNDLTHTLRPAVLPGEDLAVEIVKEGESPAQGVGYLADGTMVVVENAGDRIGERITLTVTNALQTTAGRMVFGKLADSSDPAPNRSMEEAATSQSRSSSAPQAARRSSGSKRNPRR